MADAMTLDPGFWDKLARRYSKQPVADEIAYAHTLERTRSYLGADDRVLEIGCGTGSTALKLGEACGEIVATDFAPEMIAIAREKAKGVGNVRFDAADAGLAGFEEEAFDAVLAFSLLHLVPDLQADLRRVHSVLKPGGYFISKTVCLKNEWYFRPAIGLLQLFGKAPMVTFFGPEQLNALIEAAGFEIVESAEHNKKTRGHFVVARKVQ